MNEKITKFLAEKLGMPYMSMRFVLAEWDILERPHFDVMVKENEVHVLVKNKFMPRSGFREVFGPLIERYGKAVTRCFRDDAESIAFVERIGFLRTREDAKVIYYQINHVPFQRRLPCKLN